MSFNFKSMKIVFFFNLDMKLRPFFELKNSRPNLYPILSLLVLDSKIIFFAIEILLVSQC